MRVYCMTVDAAAPSNPVGPRKDGWRPWKLSTSLVKQKCTMYPEEVVRDKKLELRVRSLFVTTCYLYIEVNAPQYLVRFTWEECLLNMLNDMVVVHQNHYTQRVYGPVHKRCNSMCQTPRRFKANVYAHNTTSFDNNFVNQFSI